MSSLLMVNPHKRKKQSYLLNPGNPFETLTIPRHEVKAWRTSKTGKFGKKTKPAKKAAKKITVKKAAPKRKNMPALALAFKKAFKKAGIKKISRKVVRRVKRVMKRSVKRSAVKRRVKKAVGALLAKPLALKVHKTKIHKGGSIMARKSRKSHRKSSRRNPFNLKQMTKGFVNTELLIDGSLVAGGMIASKFAIDFAASKVAFLATPMGKLIARVGLGSAVIMFGPKVGIKSRYAGPLALGFIAPAVVDAVSMVIPAGMLPASGVKLLEAGYMPDVPQGSVSLEQGYMPDVQETSFGFSE